MSNHLPISLSWLAIIAYPYFSWATLFEGFCQGGYARRVVGFRRSQLRQWPKQGDIGVVIGYSMSNDNGHGMAKPAYAILPS
jgi:hypothetical protein